MRTTQFFQHFQKQVGHQNVESMEKSTAEKLMIVDAPTQNVTSETCYQYNKENLFYHQLFEKKTEKPQKLQSESTWSPHRSLHFTHDDPKELVEQIPDNTMDVTERNKPNVKPNLTIHVVPTNFGTSEGQAVSHLKTQFC